VHRNESVLKNIFKRGYEEIRDRKLLEILKKDRTWLKYELHCKILCSHTFIIHNDHTYIIGDYTKLCLNIICNRSFFYFEMMSALFRLLNSRIQIEQQRHDQVDGIFPVLKIILP
jgi:hypothetical protein